MLRVWNKDSTKGGAGPFGIGVARYLILLETNNEISNFKVPAQLAILNMYSPVQFCPQPKDTCRNLFTHIIPISRFLQDDHVII